MLTERTKKNLLGVDERLQKLVLVANAVMPLEVVEGLRSPERQLELFKAGKTKIRTGGKHTLGLAIDVYARPIVVTDVKRALVLAGVMLACARQLGIEIRWGGDWDRDLDLNDQTFNDLVHFEIPS